MSSTHADVSWEDKTSLHTHSQVTQPLAYFPTMEKHQIIFFIDDKKTVILFFYVYEWHLMPCWQFCECYVQRDDDCICPHNLLQSVILIFHV